MQSHTPALGRISEMPDVSVDACVIDHNGYLVFLSLWGRDTATSELLARLTLPRTEVDSLASGLTFTAGDIQQHVQVNPDLLEKHFSRNFSRTKFGTINNLWLFDSRATDPDKANLKALVMLNENERQAGTATHPRVLSQLINLSPVPILPEWAELVATEAAKLDMIHAHATLFGGVACVEIRLEQDVLERRMSQMIQAGQLSIPA